MQYMEKDACPEKKESLENREIRVRPERKRHPPSTLQATAGNSQTLLSTLQLLPGLVHHERVPRAGEVLRVPSSPAVDVFPHWLANSQEVGPQTADGVFGYVRQRLADGEAKDEAAHRLVDARQVLGPRRLVGDARHVDGQAFATDDLRHRPPNR